MSTKVIVENFINGEFVSDNNNNNNNEQKKIPSYDPSTGEVWALIPDSGSIEVDLAVEAAEKSFPSWSSLSSADRGQYLIKIADLIDSNLERLAIAESKDQGKPVWLARQMDIPRSSHNFRTFGQAWQYLLDSSNSPPGVVNYSTRRPVGVAGLISPWNLPLYLLSFKIAPALMAGNTVVCKPSEMTSVTAWMLAGIIQQVGLPAGVVNFVFGYGASCGERIVTHPKVNMISFTGSTMVGQKIAGMAAPQMKKLSLELGGKNAAIVFDSCDLDSAVAGVARSCFLNQGEICLCTSRVFVQDGVYQEFVTRLTDKVRELKVGDPTDDTTWCGAVNSKQHYEKVMSYINLAGEEGGQILCGEGVTQLQLTDKNKGGYFIQPTLVAGLPDDSRCMQEEIFGPVSCVTSFSSVEEVVKRVNNTSYGLCASIWSKDVGTIHRVSGRLDVGTVWVNCWLVRSLDMPFGGCKMSGMGREGTRHSLEAYTEEKTVCIKIE